LWGLSRVSNLNLEKLRDLQKKIAKKISLQDAFRRPIMTIAGIDIAFKADKAITAYVLTAFHSQKIIQKKSAISPLEFPYIPTFLSFREGPPIVNMIQSLDDKPDVMMINAHGIAHPVFCGCASHVGVETCIPTIGVAQSNLCGKYQVTPKGVGRYEPLLYKQRTVGWIFQSKKGCRPIFISPGHLISLESSIEITRKSMGKYKLPTPLHYAHKLACETKNKSA
jgi:deoxyribonuclease V